MVLLETPFFGDDEHIVADICRYLQMNLESRQKKPTKKNIICIAHSSISDGQIWIVRGQIPTFHC